VQTGDQLDKAGAYAIQHPEFRPVAQMDGCFASVMGLRSVVIRLMRIMDLQPDTDFRGWKPSWSITARFRRDLNGEELLL
jgi:hypothetical protein